MALDSMLPCVIIQIDLNDYLVDWARGPPQYHS